MTQANKRAFAGVEGDTATEEVVQLLDEGVEGIGRWDVIGRRIDEGFIPLGCRAIHETTRKENLVMAVGIGVHVGSQVLNKT